jgi:fatty acid desaturase
MIDLLRPLKFKPSRNYGLTGPERQRAFDDGLVNADWYRTPVDRKILKELMKRRDGPALRDTAIWIGLLALTGAGGVYFWGTWAAVPFFVVYGILYGTSSDSRWHESLHGTAFKTDWMNDWLYNLASFMQIWNPVIWRWSHMRHHTDTTIVGRDPEIGTMRPPQMILMALNLLGLTSVPRNLITLSRHALGRFTPDERDFTPESELPKAANVARIHMAIHLAVWLSCLYWWTLLPALLIGLPRAYGVWFLLLIGLPQHAGLAEDVLDHRLNSRTILLPLPVRFIYWNMNYHVEHHMFPMVPYHALPRLHEVIKHDCPRAKGWLETWVELLPVMIRQIRDHKFYIHQELPPMAGMPNLGPRSLH